MKLKIINGTYSICRFGSASPIPNWVYKSNFYSISKSEDELSIVCESNLIPESVHTEKGWSLLKIQGQLDFSLTGILSSLIEPLAHKKISVFAISTFDTDYLLVKSAQLQLTKETLTSSGFIFNG